MKPMLSADPDRGGNNDISAAEFNRQAKFGGWPFWRGLGIGFLAAFVLGWAAFHGHPFM